MERVSVRQSCGAGTQSAVRRRRPAVHDQLEALGGASSRIRRSMPPIICFTLRPWAASSAAPFVAASPADLRREITRRPSGSAAARSALIFLCGEADRRVKPERSGRRDGHGRGRARSPGDPLRGAAATPTGPTSTGSTERPRWKWAAVSDGGAAETPARLTGMGTCPASPPHVCSVKVIMEMG
jgi:hypothetical protein